MPQKRLIAIIFADGESNIYNCPASRGHASEGKRAAFADLIGIAARDNILKMEFQMQA